MKLTTTSIRNLRPQARRQDVRDDALPALRVTVTPNGIKTFSVRYWRDGDRRFVIG